MTTAGSYDRHSHRDDDAEIQRLAAQARSGWGKEARMLVWLGLRDGMSVLEPGSGPGFVTAQLLDLLPTSTITCLEVDPVLLAQAQTELQDKAGGRVRFVEGSVLETGFEADQFDFVYARLLLQHLSDPVGAVREMFRVLKPGGKLVIYDVDDDLFGFFDPPIPEFAPVLERFGQAQAARGGDRRIGRRLWRMLRSVGFDNLELEVVASHSDEKPLESFMRHLDPQRLAWLVSGGWLTQGELDAFAAAWQTFMASAGSYTLWMMVMVCGEKPE